MNRKILLGPSILSANFSCLAEEVLQVERGGADAIHIDIMDAHFVPNLTIGPLVVAALKRVTNLPLDVHLMVERPDNLVAPFIDAGATWLTIHSEVACHHHRLIHQIKKYGLKAGLAFNPGSSLQLLDWLIDDIDIVLIMSVNPGYAGQKFIPFSLQKIRQVKKILLSKKKEKDIILAVDGGISLDNCMQVVESGANFIVMGSAIFCNENPEEMTKRVKSRIQE